MTPAKLWLMQTIIIGPLAISLHLLLTTFWEPLKHSTLPTSQNPSCSLPSTPLLVGLPQNIWLQEMCSNTTSKFRPVTEGKSLLVFASRDAVSISLGIPWSRNNAEGLPESPIQGKLVMPLLFYHYWCLSSMFVAVLGTKLEAAECVLRHQYEMTQIKRQLF